MADEPTFILSCERSGSTLLRVMLDTHKDLAAPGELGVGPLCHNLLTLLSRTLGQTELYAQGQNVAPLVANAWWPTGTAPDTPCVRAMLERTRQTVEDIMRLYAEQRQRRRWVCKAPYELPYAELLRLLWPQGRFLCLYRNCLDVVQSCLDCSRHGFMSELSSYVAVNPTNTVAALATSWADKTAQLVAFEKRWGAHRVRYEELVTRPTEVIDGVLDFVGASPSPGLVKRVFGTVHHLGGGDPKLWETDRVHADRVGAGKDLPRDRIAGELRERVNALLGELGYETL